MEAVIIAPGAHAWATERAPGGLTLLERQLRQLATLGHGPVTLLVGEDVPPSLRHDARIDAIHRIPNGQQPLAMLASVSPALPSAFLVSSAEHLIDVRVLRAAAAAERDALVDGGDEAPAPIGRLSRVAVARWGAAVARHVDRIALASIDTYVTELRGHVPPYVLPVRSPPARRRAWRLLLTHVQKRGLDLPGEYFDGPFENALVRLCAPTRVTPNQITLATLALAVVVGWCFLAGHVTLGLGLALVVGILDGVDGKLARLKLATSRLGELEHVGDFLYENFWYVALAWHFAVVTGAASLWRAGLALVGCDLVDNLLYGAVRARTGRLLDELSRFDAAFRRIGGRRNVYVWILIGGVCLRHGAGGFVVASGWAMVTVVVHAARAARWMWSGADHGRASGDQISAIDSFTAGVVIEK